METEKIRQPIIMKSSRISYDYLRGKSNAKAIPEGNTPVEAIRIKNPFNYNIRALGLQLRYKNGTGVNLIEIADNAGTPLISGDIQFAQIGNSSTADVIRDELPIDLVIAGGTEIVVNVTPIVGMDIRDLNVLLFCKQEK